MHVKVFVIPYKFYLTTASTYGLNTPAIRLCIERKNTQQKHFPFVLDFLNCAPYAHRPNYISALSKYSTPLSKSQRIRTSEPSLESSLY